MKHPVSRELFDYWDRLRDGRSAPERGDLDPVAIRGILADTFVLEIVASDRDASERDVFIRLSGTRINALFDRELKGASFMALWEPRHRLTIEAMLDGVLDDRLPTVAGVTAAPLEAAAVDLELMLLPLRHHGKTHARALGSLAPFRNPSWLGLRAVSGLRLTTMRVVPTPAEPATTPAPMVPDHAGTRFGHFTVYEGGR